MFKIAVSSSNNDPPLTMATAPCPACAQPSLTGSSSNVAAVIVGVDGVTATATASAFFPEESARYRMVLKRYSRGARRNRRVRRIRRVQRACVRVRVLECACVCLGTCARVKVRACEAPPTVVMRVAVIELFPRNVTVPCAKVTAPPSSCTCRGSAAGRPRAGHRARVRRSHICARVRDRHAVEHECAIPHVHRPSGSLRKAESTKYAH